ncbi:MAG: hypothetical protein QGH75_00005, partial [Pseudomonadales bacterium]|nr:hypothetical protein [Pseudomonadales bacterium]
MCLMRTGPDRAPTATPLIALVVTLYLFISTVSLFISGSDMGFLIALMMVVASLLVETSCVWLLLVFKKVIHRFRATLVALLGTSCILNIMLVPFNLLALNTDNESIRVFASTTDLLVFGWWVAVAGFIYSRAINVSIIQGSALALAIQVLCVVASSPMQPAS